MGKRIKRGLFAGLGLTSLSVLGKTIYDYYQEKPNQSKQSWFLGGGLALGLSYLLTQENLPQPKQLILLSPWGMPVLRALK